ncbi:MAG: hypothetical protein ACE5E9_13175 [Nitrospinaceae bacterium]
MPDLGLENGGGFFRSSTSQTKAVIDGFALFFLKLSQCQTLFKEHFINGREDQNETP